MANSNSIPKSSFNEPAQSSEIGRKTGVLGNCSPPVEHRFKEGNPGGPGRPIGAKGLNRLLREALEESDEQTSKQLVKATIINAAKGNGVALRLVWDRMEGPVTEKLEVKDVSKSPEEIRERIRALAKEVGVVGPDEEAEGTTNA